MKRLIIFFNLMFFSFGIQSLCSAQVFNVNSQTSFNQALQDARSGDTIEWENGSYNDIYLNIKRAGLVIKTKERGGVVFKKTSRILITVDNVTIDGFQFLDGDIGTEDVIKTSGSNNLFTHINIKDYRSYKYLVIKEECRNNVVSYCNFENRINLDDKNILSILVDSDEPGYHKVQYCSFKNFSGTGKDLGIEPIRIGVSTQSEFISRTLVEYCYFTQCNGDGEIISNKARQNVFRYNTFFDNPVAELVLRHGDEGIVYGNFFLNNMGGVRVREGKNHFIFNNYFSGLAKRSLYLQNESSDPLENITVLFNTFVNSAEIILGGDGNSKPKNVTIANNIFLQPNDFFFEDLTGTEVWKNNLAFGTLGITKPDGITVVDPVLEANEDGFYEILDGSPSIDGATHNYPQPFEIEGIVYDNMIAEDLMQEMRNDSAKDIGCSEFPILKQVKPLATVNNTGPSYLRPSTTSTEDISVQISAEIFPNPVSSELNLSYRLEEAQELELKIVDTFGKVVQSIMNVPSNKGDQTVKINVENLPKGIYVLQLISENRKRSKAIKFLKR